MSTALKNIVGDAIPSLNDDFAQTLAFLADIINGVLYVYAKEDTFCSQ